MFVKILCLNIEMIKKTSENLVQTFYYFQQQKIPYLFYSGTTQKTRQELYQELRNLGIPLHIHQIFTPMDATIYYCIRNHIHGFQICGHPSLDSYLQEYKQKIAFEQPQAILLGYSKSKTYQDYCEVVQFMHRGGQLFVLDERVKVLRDGEIEIGPLAISKMLESTTGQTAMHFGLGSKMFYTMLAKVYQIDLATCHFVSHRFLDDLYVVQQMQATTYLYTKDQALSQLGINEQIYPNYMIDQLFGLTK